MSDTNEQQHELEEFGVAKEGGDDSANRTDVKTPPELSLLALSLPDPKRVPGIADLLPDVYVKLEKEDFSQAEWWVSATSIPGVEARTDCNDDGVFIKTRSVRNSESELLRSGYTSESGASVVSGEPWIADLTEKSEVDNFLEFHRTERYIEMRPSIKAELEISTADIYSNMAEAEPELQSDVDSFTGFVRGEPYMSDSETDPNIKVKLELPSDIELLIENCDSTDHIATTSTGAPGNNIADMLDRIQRVELGAVFPIRALLPETTSCVRVAKKKNHPMKKSAKKTALPLTDKQARYKYVTLKTWNAISAAFDQQTASCKLCGFDGGPKRTWYHIRQHFVKFYCPCGFTHASRDSVGEHQLDKNRTERHGGATKVVYEVDEASFEGWANEVGLEGLPPFGKCIPTTTRSKAQIHAGVKAKADQRKSFTKTKDTKPVKDHTTSSTTGTRRPNKVHLTTKKEVAVTGSALGMVTTKNRLSIIPKRPSMTSTAEMEEGEIVPIVASVFCPAGEDHKRKHDPSPPRRSHSWTDRQISPRRTPQSTGARSDAHLSAVELVQVQALDAKARHYRGRAYQLRREAEELLTEASRFATAADDIRNTRSDRKQKH